MLDAFAAPRAIAALLEGFPLPWAFCGGWAIDLFLNRTTRPHKDVDVGIFRKDQHAIRSYLAARGWSLEKAANGKLLPWAEGDYLRLPVHVVWCRNPSHNPDFLELLFSETDGNRLLFRRDQSIRLPLDQALVRSKSGLPILAPEIVMLYKAKEADSEESPSDFASMLPHLDADRRAWLAEALGKIHPSHPWLQRL